MSAPYRIMCGRGETWVQTLHTATKTPLPKNLCPHFADAQEARAWVEGRIVGKVLEAIEGAWQAGKSARTSRNIATSTTLPIGRVRRALRILESTRQIESRTVHYRRHGPLAHAQGWIPTEAGRIRLMRDRAELERA